MDNFERLLRRGQIYFLVMLIIENAIMAVAWLGISLYVPTDWQIPALLGAEALLVVICIVIAIYGVGMLLTPLKTLWQAVLYIVPNSSTEQANLANLKFGRDFVSGLVNQIYQLASTNDHGAQKVSSKLDFVSTNLPLPLLVIDEKDNIQFVNVEAAKYLAKSPVDLIGKSVNDELNMSFPGNDTFESWLGRARESSAVATKTWDRIKLDLHDGQSSRQFDLVAYYNRGNAHHLETMMILYDRTEAYARGDDQADFVALAVHELRNPLTMLRGYIEVLEEELPKDASVELVNDLRKMRSSAQLLAEYTNNILNVSRIDSDQLSLHLKREKWPDIVEGVVELMRPRAMTEGIDIKLELAGGIPDVGVDRVSVSEVLTNLIDNAVKYGDKGKSITVSSRLNQSGEIETRITDFGVVLDSAVIGNLFQKFYRNHRSRSQVAGTGLGLYLSRALVQAHGGNIWITSSPEEGTIAGFTILPYDRVASADKLTNNEDITRVAHGWIKNHSLYRR